MSDNFVLSQNKDELFNVTAFMKNHLEIIDNREKGDYSLQFEDTDDNTYTLGYYPTLTRANEVSDKFFNWLNDENKNDNVFRMPPSDDFKIRTQSLNFVYPCTLKNVGIVDLSESCNDLEIMPEERFELFAYLSVGSNTFDRDVSLGHYSSEQEALSALNELCNWLSQNSKDKSSVFEIRSNKK